MRDVWDDFKIDKTVGLVFILFLFISVLAGEGVYFLVQLCTSTFVARILAIAAGIGMFAVTFKWNLRLSAWLKSRHRR